MIIAAKGNNSHTTVLQSSQVTSHPTCTRCGGLMVSEFSIDVWSPASNLDGGARRCVQCGDVTDAVILRNRRIGLVSNLLPSTVTPAPGMEPQVAAENAITWTSR